MIYSEIFGNPADLWIAAAGRSRPQYRRKWKMDVVTKIIQAARKCFGNDLEYISYDETPELPPRPYYTIKLFSQKHYFSLPVEDGRARRFAHMAEDAKLESYEIRLVDGNYEALLTPLFSTDPPLHIIVPVDVGMSENKK